MADFTGTCDNTEKLSPCSFQVWDKNGTPASLDGAPSYAASGGGSVNALADSVGTNGAPQYNFEAVSGSLATETIDITIDADGQQGSGIYALHLTGVLEVAPTPANTAAFVVGPAVKK